MIEPSDPTMNNNPIPQIPLPTPVGDGSIPSQPVAEMTWWDIWKIALFQPSVANYELLAKQAKYKKNSFLFILLIAVVAAGVYFISMSFSSAISNSILSQYNHLEGIDPTAILTASMMCALPMLMVVTVISFYLSTGFNFLLARLLKGNGSWEETVFLFIVIFFPLNLAGLFIQVIPIVQYLGFLLTLYTLVLNTIAIKAVNGFSWIKAILVTVIIPLVIFGSLCACITFAVIVPMYPQIMEAIQQAGSSYTY